MSLKGRFVSFATDPSKRLNITNFTKAKSFGFKDVKHKHINNSSNRLKN